MKTQTSTLAISRNAAIAALSAVGVTTALLLIAQAVSRRYKKSTSPIAIISDLRVHPVKSFRGHSLTSTEVDEMGFINDRRWLVALAPPPSGSAAPARFLTQRQLPLFATLTPYVLTTAAFDAVIECIDNVNDNHPVSSADVVEAARKGDPLYFPVPSTSAPSALPVALLIVVDREHNTCGARGVAASAAATADNTTHQSLRSITTITFSLSLSEISNSSVGSEKSIVFIAGSFNAWRPDVTPLVWNSILGVFTGDVDLTPGVFSYKFVVDGEWFLSSQSPTATDDKGNKNNVITVVGEGGGSGKGSRYGDDWIVVPLLHAATASPDTLYAARIWGDTVQGVVDQGAVVSAWLHAVAVSADQEDQVEEYGELAHARIRLLYMDAASHMSARPLVNSYMPSRLTAWLNPAAGSRAVAIAGGGLFSSILTRALLSPLWRLVSGGAAAAQTSFADGFPLLLASEASLADLNVRLSSRGVKPLGMERFRPNIVVRAAAAAAAAADVSGPWAEDTWADMIANPSQLRLRGVKRCSRCSITTTDQTSGVVAVAVAVAASNVDGGGGDTFASSQSAETESADTVHSALGEPLATLSTFRRGLPPFYDDVYFGVNLVHDFEVNGTIESHTLHVGDEIFINKFKPIVPL